MIEGTAPPAVLTAFTSVNVSYHLPVQNLLILMSMERATDNHVHYNQRTL